MKFNWGTGIVIAFIAFMAFVLYFVVTMNTHEEYSNYDLVTEDYYQQELEYQKTIDKEKNSRELSQNLEWFKTNQGIKIRFPEGMDYEKITGKVFLYRPSNKQFDFEIPISLSDQNLLIPDERLLGGRWNINVHWTYQETDYLYREAMIY